MVMDMGQHVVQDYAQPLTLHQVMVPGLEDRAHAFPPLSTARQLSPGNSHGRLCPGLSYPNLCAVAPPVVPQPVVFWHVACAAAVV